MYTCVLTFSGTQTGTSYSLNVNPANPEILIVGTIDGEQLHILGDKDDNGIASEIDSLILDDGKGNTTFVTFNANNSLLDKVSTLSGSEIKYKWNDDFSGVHVTAISPNGSFQVTVNVNLSDVIESMVLKQDLKKHFQDIKAKRQAKRTEIAEVPGHVYHCNKPESNAQVYAKALLNYNEEGHKWTGERIYRAIKTENSDVYHIQIYTGTSSGIGQVVEDVCKQVANDLGRGCTALSVVTLKQEVRICHAIASAAEVVTTFIPGDFVLVLNACKDGFRAVRLYCDTLGKSPPGGPSVADVLCDSISYIDRAIDFVNEDTIFLQPSAIFPAGNKVNANGLALNIQPGLSGVLPYSFTIIDNASVPIITSLTVTPEDPEPNESYIVHATYICSGPSVHVNMDIIGTDYYEDTTVCSGDVYNCTLYVPGALELVYDIVTVTINDTSTGYSFIRRVVVVF